MLVHMFPVRLTNLELNIADIALKCTFPFMYLLMLDQITSLGILAFAFRDQTLKRFFSSVSPDMIEEIVPLSESFTTSFNLAH
jgi:hypothetical protein